MRQETKGDDESGQEGERAGPRVLQPKEQPNGQHGESGGEGVWARVTRGPQSHGMSCPDPAGGDRPGTPAEEVAEIGRAGDPAEVGQDRREPKRDFRAGEGEQFDKDIVERRIDRVDAGGLQQVPPAKTGEPPGVRFVQPQALRAETIGGQDPSAQEQQQQGDPEAEVRRARSVVIHSGEGRFYRTGARENKGPALRAGPGWPCSPEA